MTASFALQQHMPKASRLVCGAMTIGHPADTTPALIDEAAALIDTALESGITVFDHADIYNAGGAEAAFGAALGRSPSVRDDIVIQSKCGIRFEDTNGPTRYDWSHDWITHSVDGSLKRLQTDFLDVLLLHRPDPLMQPDEVAEAFDTLHRAGKVRHFGVSNLNHAQIAYLQRSLGRPLIANQLQMSLLHSHWVDEVVTENNEQRHANLFSTGTIEYCRDSGVQLQAWGSLCQGILTGRNTDEQSVAVQHTAQLVSVLALKYDVSVEAIVLGWLLRHPANIQPVIGTKHPERIKACAEATTFALAHEDWWALYVSARGQRVP
ncbi:MAG: aldo/keto reductase [Pseudomonadota bacterium]